MTESIVSVKIPQPRNLEEKETRSRLEIWKVAVLNYYRRDDYFRKFLTGSWDPTQADYGFKKETEGLKREASAIQGDLQIFLQVIAAYLPHDYARTEIMHHSTSLEDVFRIIYELYDCETSSVTFLDIATMKKDQGETHRQFYLRIRSHMERHLAPASIKVENTNTGPDGDKMSVSMMDLLAQHWLTRTDSRLVNIVKIEYAAELRKGSRLCELVPQIAKSIDDLLARHGHSSVVTNRVAMGREEDGVTQSVHVDRVQNSGSRLPLPKNNYRGSGGRGQARSRGSFQRGAANFSNRPRRPTCPTCSTLRSSYNLPGLDIFHEVGKCPTIKKNALRMVEHQEDAEEDYSEEADHGEEDDAGMKTALSQNFVNRVNFQTSTNKDGVEEVQPESVILSKMLDINYNAKNLVLSDQDVKEAIVRSVDSVAKGMVDKARSPTLLARCKSRMCVAIVDEGAEVNCLDYDIAKTVDLRMVPSSQTIKAAGSSMITICGQSEEEVVLKTHFPGTVAHINLGKVLIVKNLGSDILIGEPGKSRNRIQTVPHRRMIEMEVGDIKLTKPYLDSRYNFNRQYHAARIDVSRTIYPNEEYSWPVPAELLHASHILCNPRRTDQNWFASSQKIINPDGFIKFKNVLKEPVRLRRGSVFAEMRLNEEVSIKRVHHIPYDMSMYVKDRPAHEISSPTIDHIQIDPDNLMSPEVKKKFKDLHIQYEELFTKAPGKYTGYYGPHDTCINFSDHPAPNKKVYQPSYSEEKKLALAKKMDDLIAWGVLQRPELLGITPEFVSPSMLVPKLEKDEYRYVTDFTSLNKFVRRYPTSSPTIKEAKLWLAKRRLRIELDLSNYFYQSGVTREDAQWLGVLHPYKGLYVYTVEPQGLKNSSEHAYSLLSLVYGDLCQEGRVTRVADSLYPLGDTWDELLENYQEVLSRALLAGFSFKPTKVIIAPRKSVIFGWNIMDGVWTPTEHVVSALAGAELPTTMKQLRGFLGSFKQLSECIPQYAIILTKLENLVGNNPSAARIKWSDEYKKAFEEAKKAAASPQGIITPHPDDQLITFSDYSMSHDAIGGRMIAREKTKDGKTRDRLVGHFSVMLKHKVPWSPCDGEAAGIRLTLEHFTPYIRESNKVTVHYSDNKPCIDAWKRSQHGAFSASNKISTFLTGLSTLSVEIKHKPGSMMCSEDFASRNIANCKDSSCQVCQFNQKWIKIVDKTSELRQVTIESVKSGDKSMPFLQRKAWLDVQEEDSVHSKLKYLINTAQSPEKKRTGGDQTLLKNLHTKYLAGDVKIEKDGMVMVRTQDGYFDGFAISVPRHMYPGLIQALHCRFDHPSKNQLNLLVSRYFYCPGHSSILEQVVEACMKCLSLKQLPKAFQEIHPSPTVDRLGSKFSADVIERNGQKILGVREELTKYVILKLIEDQTATSLKNALISAVLPLMSNQGTVIRTDSAPAFQTLEKESLSDSSLLKLKGIKIELGQVLNKNKNPKAENLMREIQKELLRLDPRGNQIDELKLTICQKNINDRIRDSKLSSSEMLYKRDVMNHDEIDVKDEKIKLDMEKRRVEDRKNDEKFKKKRSKVSKEEFKLGENVFVKDKLDKSQARELFTIVKLPSSSCPFVKLRKYGQQFRNKVYEAKEEMLMKSPTLPNVGEEVDNRVEEVENEDTVKPQKRPRRKAAEDALERILLRCVQCFKEEVKKLKDIPGTIINEEEDTVEIIKKVMETVDGSDSNSSSTFGTPRNISEENLTTTSSGEDVENQFLDSSADNSNLAVPLSPRTPEVITYIPPAVPTSPPQPLTTVNFFPSENSSKPSKSNPLSNPTVNTNQPSDYSAILDNLQPGLPPTPSRPKRTVPQRDYKQLNSRGFTQQ